MSWLRVTLSVRAMTHHAVCIVRGAIVMRFQSTKQLEPASWKIIRALLPRPLPPQRAAAGRFFLATGDWPQSEEFRTPYTAPLGTFPAREYADKSAALQCCSKADGPKAKPVAPKNNTTGATFGSCKKVKV